MVEGFCSCGQCGGDNIHSVTIWTGGAEEEQGSSCRFDCLVRGESVALTRNQRCEEWCILGHWVQFRVSFEMNNERLRLWIPTCRCLYCVDFKAFCLCVMSVFHQDIYHQQTKLQKLAAEIVFWVERVEDVKRILSMLCVGFVPSGGRSWRRNRTRQRGRSWGSWDAADTGDTLRDSPVGHLMFWTRDSV